MGFGILKKDCYQETLEHSFKVQAELLEIMMSIMSVATFAVLVPALGPLGLAGLWLQLCALEHLASHSDEIPHFGRVIASNVLVQQPIQAFLSWMQFGAWLVAAVVFVDLQFDIGPMVLFTAISIILKSTSRIRKAIKKAQRNSKENAQDQDKPSASESTAEMPDQMSKRKPEFDGHLEKKSPRHPPHTECQMNPLCTEEPHIGPTELPEETYAGDLPADCRSQRNSSWWNASLSPAAEVPLPRHKKDTDQKKKHKSVKGKQPRSTRTSAKGLGVSSVPDNGDVGVSSSRGDQHHLDKQENKRTKSGDKDEKKARHKAKKARNEAKSKKKELTENAQITLISI